MEEVPPNGSQRENATKRQPNPCSGVLQRIWRLQCKKQLQIIIKKQNLKRKKTKNVLLKEEARARRSLPLRKGFETKKHRAPVGALELFLQLH